MPEEDVNLVNPQCISAYLKRFTENYKDPDLLEKYLTLALEKPLRKDCAYLHRLDNLPHGAPDWLAERWGKAVFHEFIPNKDLDAKISCVKDWIETCLEQGEPWTEHLDSEGRPLKLLKIGSLEQALKEVEKAQQFQQQRKEHHSMEAFEYELGLGDIVISKSYDDGFRMVQILTRMGAAKEAYLMQHCIADEDYKELFLNVNPESQTAFYSLRDSSNNPHATLEVDLRTKKIIQCKGKQNKPPIDKYVSKIEGFIKDFKLTFTDFSRLHGYVFFEGRTYDLKALPDNFVFEGTLNIKHLQDFTCPVNLTVTGNLIMDTMQRPFLNSCLKVEGDIEEDFQIGQGAIRIVMHRHEFGRVHCEKWILDRKLHREDGPAVIHYDKRTGKVIAEKWYSQGDLHREDGPAVQSWDSMSGRLISQSYYIGGQYIKNPEGRGQAA